MVILSPRLTWGLWDPFTNGRTYFMAYFHGAPPLTTYIQWGHVIFQGIAAASPTTPPASPTENYRVKSSPTGRVGRGEAPMSKELCTFPKKAAELTFHFSDFFFLVDRCTLPIRQICEVNECLQAFGGYICFIFGSSFGSSLLGACSPTIFGIIRSKVFFSRFS